MPLTRSLTRRTAEAYLTHHPHERDSPAGLLSLLDCAYGPADQAPAEEAHQVIDATLDSVSGIAYDSAHGDPELVERGRRTPARLRAEHHDFLPPTGEAR
ncbi:hypothetical protein [Streptomyces pilosus]|uniref:Uncharacterized protein n=1 Tax=Streptomyces pilosus TaxID=28893 RepID=A0A918C1U4_9ACTN|nr:hypothetical protein [Streptomyces pilosus]GGR01373.1 hypothetical protein GCM10010280_56810 [Streptomyces pilosus]